MVRESHEHPEAINPDAPTIPQLRRRVLALIMGIWLLYMAVLYVDGLTLDWVGIGTLVVGVLGITIDVSIRVSNSFKSMDRRLTNIEGYLRYAVRGSRRFDPED